ncbi:MAG: serine hydrolase domain-containing protein [Actinomycetota bacterium]|nr:serine hydrolase domain-containing protein [Actinomycetota bacterium]
MEPVAAPLGGTCDRAFAAVEQAFADNFALRGELGGAVCVVVDGRTVCDLWGGWRDEARARPWAPETLVNLFSVGKGLASACVARLVGTSDLDPDAAVARLWPEFAAGGKGAITLRQVLSHQAGLPAVRRRLPPGAMLDHDVMARALAAEEPWWPPGSAHGYHVNTWGFLVGELVRRTTGRTLGAVLASDLAGPLGADVHLGLPAREHHRVADFPWPGEVAPEEEPPGLDEHGLMVHNTYFNPSGLSGAGVLGSSAWRSAESPSTNAHGTARGVARVYELLAAGGRLGDDRVIDSGALAAATTEQVDGPDLVLGRPSRFGLGFQLPRPERPFGPNPGAFGHFGAGGSLGFCDPEAGVAFGYVMNEMGPRWQNPRNRALLDAVYASLA